LKTIHLRVMSDFDDVKNIRFGVAVILLFDEQKRILVQHRSMDQKRSPGKWGFFGGGIDEGETPEEAVKRECQEELNYTLTAPLLVMSQQVDVTKYVFVEQFDSTKKLIQEEGQAMEWIDPSDPQIFEKNWIEHDIPVLKHIIGLY
jgi:mutator protein MutT